MTTFWDGSYPPSLFAPPVVPVAGVNAGTPGAFTPANAQVPANLAALQTDPVVGNAGTNKPGPTPWTAGQYVVLGNGSFAHWNGAWAVGPAPALRQQPATAPKRKEGRGSASSSR